MNTSYILQSMKYHSNEPAEFIQILHEYSKVVVVVLKHIREKIGWILPAFWEIFFVS